MRLQCLVSPQGSCISNVINPLHLSFLSLNFPHGVWCTLSGSFSFMFSTELFRRRFFFFGPRNRTRTLGWWLIQSQLVFTKGHTYLIAFSPIHSHGSLSKYLMTHAYTFFHSKNDILGIGEIALGEVRATVGTTFYPKENLLHSLSEKERRMFWLIVAVMGKVPSVLSVLLNRCVYSNAISNRWHFNSFYKFVS